MTISNSDPSDAECSRVTELKQSVSARLGVTGDFIRVPQLAKALGISATSIHSQMRRGIFPIFHRRVGNVILVKLDDYVRWFDGVDACGSPTMAEPCAAPAEPRRPTLESREGGEVLAPNAKTEKPEDFRIRLDREILASMREKGYDV